MLLFRQLFDDPVSAHYGIPEHIVRRMGNWKDRRMLDRYAHLADETLREAEARLAARLNRRRGQPQHPVGYSGRDSPTAFPVGII